jgi:hypothetical protein
MLMSMLAAITLAACAANPRPGVEYVRRGPPPERVEVVTAAPYADAVWIRGHWAWRRNDYEWVPGRWTRIERGYHEWVPGHWDHDRYGWYYIEGHWR